MVVALAPVADTPPALYPQKPTQNGIVHSEKTESVQPAPHDIVIADPISSSKSDSADPMPITANGNDSAHNANVDLPAIVDSTTPYGNGSTDRKMAVEVLKVIESYGVDYEKSGGSWKGLESFIPIVEEQVKRQEPIRMILPAFPFKSPNCRDKVLGTMPDFAEELALAHLNGLCENIAQVYSPGADVYISSDGLVYNGESILPRVLHPTNTFYQIY